MRVIIQGSKGVLLDVIRVLKPEEVSDGVRRLHRDSKMFYLLNDRGQEVYFPDYQVTPIE
jgi:hypothetical protein